MASQTYTGWERPPRNSGSVDQKGSIEEVAVDRGFEYWVGFGNRNMGIEGCFRTSDNVGEKPSGRKMQPMARSGGLVREDMPCRQEDAGEL